MYGFSYSIGHREPGGRDVVDRGCDGAGARGAVGGEGCDGCQDPAAGSRDSTDTSTHSNLSPTPHLT